MNVDALGFIAPLTQPSLAPLANNQPAPAAGFGAFFSGELSRVNGELVRADQAVMGLAAGEPTSLHGLMIQLEEAQMSFQLLAQVRNRVLEAYQEVSRMQI